MIKRLKKLSRMMGVAGMCYVPIPLDNLDKLLAVCEAVQAEKKIRDDAKRMGGNNFIDVGGPEAHQEAMENLDKALAALEEG